MKKISILDCTLRDGGYVNQWEFGKENIYNIITGLSNACIDIIECGFLRDQPYILERAVFSSINQITPFIHSNDSNTMHVAMLALGDISPEKICHRKDGYIDGIRLTFHKHEWKQAKAVVMKLMDKGYKVFIQPVGTTSYSDRELLDLIEDVNEIHPFAFYLVDTLGQLYIKDLIRLATFIDHNLDVSIAMGFHSHNNLQLSMANAVELIHQDFWRHLIIDASVYGMGRGVGNLPTELLAQYINKNIDAKYDVTSLMIIAERYLMSIYSENRWGYDLPYFLSASIECHPNYASFLMKKETLSIEDISLLLHKIPIGKRDLFCRETIEKLYLEFQNTYIDDSKCIHDLYKRFYNKTIILLAPGQSIITYQNEIKKIKENNEAIIISVNFIPDIYDQEFVFISNRKRLNLLKTRLTKDIFVIATSNLIKEFYDNFCIINYSSYLGKDSSEDNAGAMLIRLLARLGVKELFLAGFDGFEVDVSVNYYEDSFKRKMEKKTVERKNESISSQLRDALKEVSYQIITPTRYHI